MKLDEDKFRQLCQENGSEWCIDMLVKANNLIFEGHKLIKKAQILITGTMDALRDHQNESNPHTDADLRLYTSVSSLASALGMSSGSNRENE